MASGSQSSSEPIVPTRVWTLEEWLQEQPWGGMPKSDLRDQFKAEGFRYLYGGGPQKFRDTYKNYGTATGRFKTRGNVFDVQA